MIHRFSLCLSLSFCLFLFACQPSKEVQIVIAENATTTEQMTAEDLKADLLKVTDLVVRIVSEHTVKKGQKIILGTPTSNHLVKEKLAKQGIILTAENPGARGGLWQKIDEHTIILAGSDVQGMQYAVYDYSEKVLKIDPLQYWTGHPVEAIYSEQVFEFANQRIAPPIVPLLVYFENDVDELANLKEPLLEYDWESYTQMIDALVRMRYNGIHFFDMLGRPEFFLRPSYQQILPDYQINIDYLDQMIDYAQDKGMKVQIDMSLGYQIKPMDVAYADCWTENKDKWKAAWRYYLEKTPIGKADIFSLRPRNQVWDWEYKSICGEYKINVFNEVYSTIDTIIDQHNPNAIKVVVCYDDGMDLFNQGFTPPKDWIIAWSDNGYADFKLYPESTKGYDFGTYMHAGFWKDHTVASPNVAQIDHIMHKIFDEYGATKYCEVNGQTFRPFLFNLEVFSEVCQMPDSFTANGFYQQWADRYFPDSLTDQAIDVMEAWTKASFGKAGYVESLWEIREVIAYLSRSPIERPGKTPVPYTAERVENDLAACRNRYELIKIALNKAEQLYPKVADSPFFHDQVYLPIRLYSDLLAFERILHEMFLLQRSYEQKPDVHLKNKAKSLLKKARNQLDLIYENRLKGDINRRWEGWYDPAKRRPNNGFPTAEMLDAIELAQSHSQ